MRKQFCLTALAVCVLLSGCTNVPDLSRVHSSMEAEYMAGLMLKYDANYEDMLDYDRSVLKPTPTPQPTRKPEPESQDSKGDDKAGAASSGSSGDGQTTSVVTMEELGQIQGVKLVRGSYSLQNDYGTAFLTVTAPKGKKLLIAKLRLKNTGSSPQKVDMTKEEISFSLEIDGDKTISPKQTLLEEDLRFYHGKIAAGKSKETVLVFEVDASQKVKKAVLNVKKGNRTAQLALN